MHRWLQERKENSTLYEDGNKCTDECMRQREFDLSWKWKYIHLRGREKKVYKDRTGKPYQILLCYMVSIKLTSYHFL